MKMSLNVTKCCVIVYDSGESVSCFASDTSVPAVRKYIYLDLPMAADLGLNAIVKDKKEMATNAYHTMRSFLTHRHIPALIRTQMVLSALVPIATYGCELYGISSSRILSI